MIRIIRCLARNILIFFILPSLFWQVQGISGEPLFVRVAVVKDAPSAKILIAGAYRIMDAVTSELLREDKYLSAVDIISVETGFKFGEIIVNADAILIVPVGGARLYVHGRVFRGDIKVLRSADSITIVNIVELEEYLYGVIRNEVSTWWPMEALKAQAIAARTYVLYQMRESSGRNYDVTADVSSQVYGGMFSERWRTNRAVDLTKGKVLSYNGTIFPAYFHATCGGATCDASNLWKIDLTPLKGVVCNWCEKSPHYSWEKWIEINEIRNKLENRGYVVGEIKGFDITKRDSSGRVMEIQIRGIEDNVVITAKDFRTIVGSDALRSTNFKITIIGDYVVFEGLGWGHGVGMCQWGSYYMSRAGRKAEEILGFYYPGATIMDYKNIK